MLERMIAVVLVVALAIGVPSVTAQSQPFRACLVNSATVLKAHPQGKVAASLRENAQKELQPLAEQIKALQAKAATGSITAAERQQADTLSKTYQATAQKWQKKIDAAIAPIIQEVDAAVEKVAIQQKCTMVFDSVASGPSGAGVIVYADLAETDITADVIRLLTK